MTSDEFAEILREHQLWTEDSNKGKRAVLNGMDLSEVKLIGVNLKCASLMHVNLWKNDLRNSTLSFAFLSRANLNNSDLSGAYLNNARLDGASLVYAILDGVNLSEANLTSANLYKAYLRNANLDNTNLWGTNLFGAYLGGTCLDPEAKPNGDVSGFEKDGEFVIGYRTRNAFHIGKYLDNRIYAADWFSVSETECHPGLYLYPNLLFLKEPDWACIEEKYKQTIRVRTKPNDVHKAGNKWRCRWFEVLGKV
jgi:hypothetical protein